MKRPVLTIAFDDGYIDAYNHAIAYLNEVGLKCTFAVPAGLIGKTCEKRPVLGWEQIGELTNKGHEIASHTLHHVNLLKTTSTHNSVKKEIEGPKAILEKRISGLTIDSFVYPYIDKLPDPDIQKYVKTTYTSARISEDSPIYNSLPIMDFYSLKGFCVNNTYALKDLQGHIEHTLETNCYFIEVFHLVGKKNTMSSSKNEPYRFYLHIDNFKKHIDFILKSDIEVLTQRDAVNVFSSS